jgi:hypothetical protein
MIRENLAEIYLVESKIVIPSKAARVVREKTG